MKKETFYALLKEELHQKVFGDSIEYLLDKLKNNEIKLKNNGQNEIVYTPTTKKIYKIEPKFNGENHLTRSVHEAEKLKVTFFKNTIINIEIDWKYCKPIGKFLDGLD